MAAERISEKITYPSKFIDVNGVKIHYVETGIGNPILFLHGIPTSCYIWRNIIPHLASLGRCVAPDLVGFGQSEKPDIEYSIENHIKFIEGFIEALGLKQLTLVMHGWGSVIGFDYAMKHEKNCAGLIFYEAFLNNSAGFSLPYQEQLLILREQEERKVFQQNGAAFVDKFMPQTLMRELTAEEIKNYKKPFQQSGSGKPILDYLHELPTGEGESKVDRIIANYSEKLTKSFIPKLMMYSVPGFMTTIETVIWAKENLPNVEIVDIGEEMHFAQESSPQLMGETMSVWLQGVEQSHE